MCHHGDSVDELDADAREELLDEHDRETLRAELSADELETLGVSG